MDKELACYALTPEGAGLARRLATALDGHLFLPPPLCRQEEDSFESLPLLLGETFTRFRSHIFVCASGIAVRCIAPHLIHKSSDPAVVVSDEAGRFAVSLLSGHWGGGNALATQVADITGGTAVITTGTDVRGLPSVDLLVQEAGCTIVDWDKVKIVNAALLRGESVQVSDPTGFLGALDATHFRAVALPEDTRKGSTLPPLDPEAPALCVDWRLVPARSKLLRVALPALHLGVGCRRGVSAAEILQAVQTTLHEAHMEQRALAGLASVKAKEDEQGLIQAARTLGVPLHFFSPEELSDAPTLTPSAMAAQLFGVERICVSEGAAMLAAGGDDATLLIPKIKYNERITVAVAVSESLLPPTGDLL